MPDITYTCGVCGYQFSSEDALKDHMLQAHATKTEVAQEGESK